MWFQRKVKNRKLGRERILDVKLRSSQVRRARIRLAALALGVLFGTVFGLYLLWRGGDWLLTRLVYDNSAFAIRQLDVQSDGGLAGSQLCRWAGVKLNQNLLALDLARVKRNLELVPLIQSVSVERVLPRTLRIRVTERESIAEVNVPRPRMSGGIETVGYQLDPEGYVMQPLGAARGGETPGSSNELLTVISGLDPRELQLGRRVELPQLQAALRLLVAFQQSPMAGLVDLKSIDITAPEVLLVRTGQGNEIVFSPEDIEQQLRRWRAIFDLGQSLSKAIASLDLAVTNSVPLRWQDPGGPPPSPARPPKPLRVLKKHV